MVMWLVRCCTRALEETRVEEVVVRCLQWVEENEENYQPVEDTAYGDRVEAGMSRVIPVCSHLLFG